MQNVDMERKITGILRVLSRAPGPVGAVVIARELEAEGIELDSRTVRYHLKIMDERGLTLKHGREGRTIAPGGMRELEDSLVFDRVGYIISKIESLSCLATFDPDTLEGKLIVNTAIVPLSKFDAVRATVLSVLGRGIGLSSLAAFRSEGETLGDLIVPEGMAGIATVCSILVNSVLIKRGIPVDAKFGGVIEMSGGQPRRFTEAINYSGSSTDPLELFMRGRFTSVAQFAHTGNGKILANLREIPSAALPAAEDILARLKNAGFGGVLGIGKPGQPLFGASAAPNRCAIAVMGGLNAFAACQESGIEMNASAISTLASFHELAPADKLKK